MIPLVVPSAQAEIRMPRCWRETNTDVIVHWGQGRLPPNGLERTFLSALIDLSWILSKTVVHSVALVDVVLGRLPPIVGDSRWQP